MCSRKNYDEEGYFCTGDIVEYDSVSGKLNIIDRRKNIVKLAQGEFVAPEYLENIFLQCPLVDCIFIYANIIHSFVVSCCFFFLPKIQRQYSFSLLLLFLNLIHFRVGQNKTILRTHPLKIYANFLK